MLDLMLHIDSYDKSICRTVSIGHIPESKEKFYKNNLYHAFKGFVIPRRILSILGCLLSYVRSTVCEFPFLSYCAASLAMLISGGKEKKILKFHLREHVTNVRDMEWNNFSSFEESSSVPEKTFE